MVTILLQQDKLDGVNFDTKRRLAIFALTSLCIRARGEGNGGSFYSLNRYNPYDSGEEDDDEGSGFSSGEEAEIEKKPKKHRSEGNPASAALLFKTVCAMLLEDDPSVFHDSILEMTFPSWFDEEQKKQLVALCIHNSISLLNGKHIASLTPGGEAGEAEENKVRELRRLATWQERGAGEPSAFALTRLALFRQECDFPLFDAWIRGPLAVSRFAAHFNLPPGLQHDNNNHNNNDKSEGRRGVEVLEPRALQEVFSFLDPVSLCRVEQVCMLWREVSRENLLWVRHLREAVAKKNQTMKSRGEAMDTQVIETFIEKALARSTKKSNGKVKLKFADEYSEAITNPTIQDMTKVPTPSPFLFFMMI